MKQHTQKLETVYKIRILVVSTHFMCCPVHPAFSTWVDVY